MQIVLFRSLVVISAVLYVVWYFLPYESFASDDLAAVNLLNLDGYAAIFKPKSSFFTVGILALWLVAVVGLLRFRNWSRYLYLGLTIWALVAATLYGIRVSSPLEEVLGLAIDLLDGVILALIFLSPLKTNFSSQADRSS